MRIPESNEIIHCCECGDRIITPNGVILGEKTVKNDALGICSDCSTLLSYLTNGRQYRENFNELEFSLMMNTCIDCIVLDIDGTICREKAFNLIDTKSKIDTEYFDEVRRYLPKCILLNPSIKFIYLSGRMEKYRELTEKQLRENKFPIGDVVLYNGDEDDVNFVESVTSWKFSHIKDILSVYGRVMVMDDNYRIIDMIMRNFIMIRSLTDLDLGRCYLLYIQPKPKHSIGE